ncbi:MAG: hypothetical protein HWN65_09895 [Candidatus Helarchaeota archaeon]|nr:hypothetical protein [Candidatus Helarchaeota archaeon]
MYGIGARNWNWQVVFILMDGRQPFMAGRIPESRSTPKFHKRTTGVKENIKGVNLYGGHVIKRMHGIHHEKPNLHSTGTH